MRISEMNNDMAMDAMVRISGALNIVMEDTEVRQLIEDLGGEKGGGLTLWDAVTKYMPRIVAIAAKRHRDSLYEIVGALNQKDAKQVGAMNFRETVALIQENWSELRDFFPRTDFSTAQTGS